MQFMVTAEKLEIFAAYCLAQVDQIQAQVKTLGSEIEQLTGGSYSGPASVQLELDMVDVKLKADALQNAMNDIVATLKSNSNNYTQGETQNLSNLQAAQASAALQQAGAG